MSRIQQGEGNGNPLQYSCLENPGDRGTLWETVYRVTESDTTERLSPALLLMLSHFSRVRLCAIPWTVTHQAPLSLGILQTRILEWAAMLSSKEIFPTQGSNPGLLYCRQIVYFLNHQGSPRMLEWVAYSFSRGTCPPSNQTGVSCFAGGFLTSWATREHPI